ncbi:A24 family peptidase [Thermomicrobium sp. 4228-Ro]|uniref:prepilin peptidase n=1 Tax=Thermomicrobium sp. 4228-Ro TaxID=2993937 RepID=UPI002248E6F3|nr:A24 family peptidase [Thermomicrobium sp. 4228-Ro]MCX2727887.1 A24 family peptidase [Thermomicrobium sp. 4228-Ro]
MSASLLIMLPFVTLAGFLLGGLIELTALRLPSGEPFLVRSSCPGCGADRPRWSWFLPRRCSSCRAVPRTQLTVQLLTAATLALVWLRFFADALDVFRVSLFVLLLFLIARIDWAHHLIYLVTIVPTLIFTLLLALVTSLRTFLLAVTGMTSAAAVFAVFYGLGWLLYRRAALGSGDILLAALIGAMVGVMRVLPTLLLGMVLAALAATYLLALRRAGRMTYLPYGTFLAAGTVVGLLLWGPA